MLHTVLQSKSSITKGDLKDHLDHFQVFLNSFFISGDVFIVNNIEIFA